MGGFQCKKCNKHFRRQWDYARHVEDDHSELRFECDECGRGFLRRFELNYHLETDHDTEKPLDEHCNVDERTFKKVKTAHFAASKQTDHPPSHRLRPPYRCKPCGTVFDEQEKFSHKDDCPRSHWRECEFCEKAFLAQKDLNKHALLKHKLRPNWKLNKHEVFVSNWADEIRAMERRKMGGTIIFNHHQPPSDDKFLRELSERAIRDVDVPCTWGTFKHTFDTSQPTHDGAAVVKFFEEGTHDVPRLKGRGTRHTAAYYASLRTDALIVVVSEESATKKLPATTTFLRGSIECGVSLKRMKQLLRDKYFEGK
ncbi:DNA integrity scanning protein [Aphelenchoides avenae]|nr:DNA integrity scanning protein [Aphelenchus avenae]